MISNAAYVCFLSGLPNPCLKASVITPNFQLFFYRMNYQGAACRFMATTRSMPARSRSIRGSFCALLNPASAKILTISLACPCPASSSDPALCRKALAATQSDRPISLQPIRSTIQRPASDRNIAPKHRACRSPASGCKAGSIQPDRTVPPELRTNRRAEMQHDRRVQARAHSAGRWRSHRRRCRLPPPRRAAIQRGGLTKCSPIRCRDRGSAME